MVVMVAPFTGAWIEIDDEYKRIKIALRVAPFTGAWIEDKVKYISQI